MKKTRRIFNKSVRKTVGALFLASSVVVAAIPTTSYQGGTALAENFTDAPDYAERYELGHHPGLASTDPRYTATDTLLNSSSSSVPMIKPRSSSGNPDDITDVTVYTSEDSLYQFAYVSMEGVEAEDGNEKFAFVLKYNTPGSLPGGNLTIPDTVDAYLAYNTNDGSGNAANVAVGKAGNYLFYKQVTHIEQYDVSGFDVSYDEVKYLPCYATSRADWKDISDEDLYFYNLPSNNYRPDGSIEPTRVGTDQRYQRITNAPVRFIANQYIETSGGLTHIKPITQPSQGIFYGNGNIQNLITGGNLNGIGNYAFYNCSGLSKFSFSNGLNAIGNHAFEYCTSLATIEIPSNTNLQVIGAYAFKNCQMLQSFKVPTSVVLLCDGVFQNCINLTNCVLYGDNIASSALRYIGNGVFFNCQQLEGLEFPAMYTEDDFNISNLYQCYGLKWLRTNNTSMNIIADTNPNESFASDTKFTSPFTFEEFLDNISPNFYISGVEIGNDAQNSPQTKWGAIHNTCKDEQIAYNYRGTQYFEKTITEEGGGTATYLVDGSNNLENCNIVGKVYTLTFPEYIGPNYIKAIGDRAFTNICTLTMITIPSTIQSIGTEAFKGCHNLQYVYFETDTVDIGTDAFKTQACTAHNTYCTTENVTISQRAFNLYNSNDMTDASHNPKVQLYFVGTIDSSATPYNYAMSYDGRFNNESQTKTFVRFLSGYPTCQEIAFVLDSPTSDTGKATLVNFPVLSNTNDLADPDNVDTSYLTKAQKDALLTAQYDFNHDQATEDQIAFVNATHNLVIPYGVEAIQNGLFYEKTYQAIDAMGVTLYGINEIEAVKDPSCSAEDIAAEACPPDVVLKTITTSAGTCPDADFAGCPNLTSIVLMGTDTKQLDDFAFSDCTGVESLQVYCPVSTIGDHCFTGDTALTEVDLNNTVGTIERHAFEDCTSLKDVSIDSSLNQLGVAPFKGCDSLSNVNLNNNSRFVCDSSVIYSVDENGTKRALIECLGGKNRLNALEAKGITAISEEAFAGCRNIVAVDLTDSEVTSIPEKCFQDTPKLRDVRLPYTTTRIQNYAFEESGVDYIQATQFFDPSSCGDFAFDHMLSTGYDPATGTGDHTNNKNVTICAPEDSNFYNFGYNKGYTVTTAPKAPDFYQVTFYHAADDASFGINMRWSQIGDSQTVKEGESAIPPADSEVYVKAGYRFTGWYPSYENISEDTSVYAQYEELDPNAGKYTVRFYLDDAYTDLYETVLVYSGEDAASGVRIPYREGYKFTGWSGRTTPIDQNSDVYAQWEPLKEGYWTVDYYTYDGNTLVYSVDIKDGESAPNYQGPERAGYVFTGWNVDLSSITKDTMTFATYQEIEVVNPDDGTWTVTYYSYDGSYVVFTTRVRDGGTAPYIQGPARDGYEFTGWNVDLSVITKDTNAFAQYKEVYTPDPNEGEWKVTYYAYDGTTVVYSITVKDGEAAPIINGPDREGYIFTGWSGDLSSITKDTFTIAQYSIDTSSTEPSPAPSPAPDPTPTPDPVTPAAVYYTLTVVNGSGSGSYIAGTNVVIIADAPGAGKQFGNWSISPSTAPIATKVLASTVVTMPAENVTVTANFVAATSNNTNNGSNGTGSGTNNNGNNNNNNGNNTNYWPSTGNVPRSSGTTVVIDKNGLSNTGVVSATVNGSTDNFTIRITESATAEKAILDALLRKYGTLENIIYFPFDISLYDAAGTTQITDTSGLTITITIPIPDSLVPYAANNKIACITNGELDGLNGKFTTINGVPCVTFTCTHFSPYVIYVNTVQLAAGSDGSGIGTGTGLDNTPKTADPIHPKWFVSIALFAISIVLFLLKDKRTLAVIQTNGSTAARTGNRRPEYDRNSASRSTATRSNTGSSVASRTNANRSNVNRSNVNRSNINRSNFTNPNNRPGPKR